jgi:hypothetical protein
VSQNSSLNVISISKDLLQFRLRGIHRNAHDAVDGRLLISRVLKRWLNDLIGGIMGLPLVRVSFEGGPTSMSIYSSSCLSETVFVYVFYVDVYRALPSRLYTVEKICTITKPPLDLYLSSDSLVNQSRAGSLRLCLAE